MKLVHSPAKSPAINILVLSPMFQSFVKFYPSENPMNPIKLFGAFPTITGLTPLNSDTVDSYLIIFIAQSRIPLYLEPPVCSRTLIVSRGYPTNVEQVPEIIAMNPLRT
jgi:hypothetical protein